MKKGRFIEEQIIAILKGHEAGQKVAELQTDDLKLMVCRRKAGT